MARETICLNRHSRHVRNFIPAREDLDNTADFGNCSVVGGHLK